jgi:YVTN family beta-propeller protein
MRRAGLCLTLAVAGVLGALCPPAASAQVTPARASPGLAAQPIRPYPNDQAAYAFFLGKGLADYQAAGVVGNLDVESHDDPAAIQKHCTGKCGRGIAQWNTGQRWNRYRRDNMVWYATTLPGRPSPATLNPQLEFIWYELSRFPRYGLAALRAARNADDAATVFARKFEQCGKCRIASRLAYARATIAAFGATAYVLAQGGDVVTPVKVATNTIGKPIRAVVPEAGVAAPDGQTVYIATQNSTFPTVDGSVIPINVSTDTAGKRVRIGERPGAIAITPSGRTVYVATENDVTAINTATDKVIKNIKAGVAATAIFIPPGGATAYAVSANSDAVTPIRTATQTAEKPISLGLTDTGPVAAVMSPDGKHIYVFDTTAWTLTTVNTASNTADRPVQMQFGVTDAVITPDGGTIYGIELDNNDVVPIDPATAGAGKPIAVGLVPEALAVTPDGSTVYVANLDGGSVTPIDTSSDKAGKAIAVPGDPFALAVTPGGETLYVSSGGDRQDVIPISTGSNKRGEAIGVPDAAGPIVMAP